MPNPVRSLKRTDRLTKRQKMIVRKVRGAGLPVMVYARPKKKGRVSVHDPFLDVRRRAKIGSLPKTKRYPQARDTSIQRMVRSIGKRPKGARKVPRRATRKFLSP